MTYVVAAALIRAFIEGFKKAGLTSEIALKALAFVGAAVAVFGWGLNAMAEVGLTSKYLVLDLGLSVVALGLLVMIEHDVFAALVALKKAARAKATGQPNP